MAERADYPHFTPLATRWSDNDVYGHVNNVQYYGYFDTVINSYLVHAGSLDFVNGPLIGVVAESHCKYIAEVSFPEALDVGLRVEHVGRSSVRYGVGLFRAGAPQAAAEGWFVHVFIDRNTRRPKPLTPELRDAVEQILVAAKPAVATEKLA